VKKATITTSADAVDYSTDIILGKDSKSILTISKQPIKEEEDDDDDDEEQEEPIDPELLRLQNAEQALNQPDAIMEPNCLDNVRELISLDGGKWTRLSEELELTMMDPSLSAKSTFSTNTTSWWRWNIIIL
jgi:TH1 protein